MSFFGGRDDDNDRPSGGNMTHGGSYPAGGYGGRDDDDFSGAAEHASRHAGDSGDRGLFDNILGALGQKKQHLANQDIDEEHAVNQHQKFYGGGGNDGEADDRSMGTAAAMQALKMFSGGGSGSSASGNSQSAFIGMAMAEASKLFDQQSAQGKVSGGSSKDQAVSKAAEMALQMYMKSKGGSSSSGGMGSLLGLASKFM